MDQISMVFQRVYLFQDTIRRNIDLSGKNDDETIQEVCRQCGLGEFIEKVTLDYTVGRNGMMLSLTEKK